ncbi:peptide-methionine (S)-S-oxide reductase MsrA [Lutibacter sp.]|uniref:peptide-methionine (S)-S-oxide reductase MsrA n=1 Tax=Lutibacter sp. TaxID=1925666 RepID=UPI0027355357|nr:peptide-methionine (S)-S-oxide reductase MsrA [Lutibacter sp.]
MKKQLILLALTFLVTNNMLSQSSLIKKSKMNTKIETATLANGCFWCTEAIFQRLKGVETVKSGYTGGKLINPTYNDITTGLTEHAEAIQIKFDASEISFQEILEVFFSTHDPTTKNKQGFDVGTQYRSAIFYHNETQKLIAENFIKELTEAHVFENKIVTEISKADIFYIAEEYHQNYYNNNKTQGYCVAVINPKLDKFLKKFKNKLKEN